MPSIVIYAGDQTYHADLSSGLSEELGPVDPAPHKDMVWGDNSDPSDDSGDNAPVSPNRAPPAAPFPAKVPPSSSMPPSGAPPGKDTPDKPDPMDTTGPGTNDEQSEEYVGGGKVDPAPLPNPEGGALAPNPDNDTSIPVGGKQEGQNPDSFDQGKRPDIGSQPWFMGSEMPTFKTSSRLSLAEWPLRFAQIERDFHRPNKVSSPNTEPNDSGNEDATKLGDTDKPYQTGTPPI